MGVLDWDYVSDEEFQVALKNLRRARKEMTMKKWYTDLD